ncbi:hypothetical protein KFU94_08510 [Chloroflexi bacterium TSY]|nr:hypothetical protein [Chloroflexi bacterium TSY]
MLERIGGQFIGRVPIDPAMTVAVPAPEGVGVVVGAMAATAFVAFLTSIIALTQLLAVGIGPSGQFGAVASHMEMVQVEQAQLD